MQAFCADAAVVNKLLMMALERAPAFEAGGFTEVTPEVFRNVSITGHFGSIFEENSVSDLENHVISVTSSFSKSSVSKMFSIHTKTISRRFQFLRFEK